MKNEYDSILKEKKVYEDNVVVHKHKYFKLSIFLSFLIAILIIVVSYFIYFNTVLSSESIILNDILLIKNDYSTIYDDIYFPYNLSKNHVIDGSIDIGNDNYKNSFEKDVNKIKRTFYNDDKKVVYYADGKNNPAPCIPIK